MAFGDLSLDAPEKPNKGQEGGACNRRSCQAEPALWYSHAMHHWYCEDCRNAIEFDPVNMRHRATDLPHIKHALFETREMWDARLAEIAQERIEYKPTPLHEAKLEPEDVVPEEEVDDSLPKLRSGARTETHVFNNTKYEVTTGYDDKNRKIAIISTGGHPQRRRNGTTNVLDVEVIDGWGRRKIEGWLNRIMEERPWETRQ